MSYHPLDKLPPAADWKVSVLGERSFEVAICRAAYVHGFKSFGWDDGDKKIILFELNTDNKPAPIVEVVQRYMEAHLIPFAQACADAMNHVESQALLKGQ